MAYGKMPLILYVALIVTRIVVSSVVERGGPAQLIRFSVSKMYSETGGADDGTRYGILSESKMISLSRNRTLKLLETHKGSNKILATMNFENQPEELRYFEFEGSVYITVIYRRSSKVCTYSYHAGTTTMTQHKCATPTNILALKHQRQDPSTLGNIYNIKRIVAKIYNKRNF